MHLLEKYALSTGSKIKKPFILKKFFPIPFEKYITIQNSSGMAGKCYDYFQEVINFIYPELLKNNITIIQIGSKEDKSLNNVVCLQGQTSIHQTAYILSNSMLHIGNDSFAIHMASAFGIPLIGLYSVSSPEIAGPFWKNQNQICLTPSDWRPSFNPQENPKKVNEIKVENIIQSINKLLFNNSNKQIETYFIGSKYSNSILECYPDQLIPPELKPGHLLNIRLDYKDITDLNAIIGNLNNRPCCFITNKSFNFELIKQFQKNIAMIIYDITENIDTKYIDYLSYLGVRFACIFNIDKGSVEDLNDRKLKLMDSTVQIEEISHVNSSLDLTIPNLIYKTNKIIIANNKIYPSKVAVDEDKPVNMSNITIEQKISEIEDLESLKTESDFFYIYKQIT